MKSKAPPKKSDKVEQTGVPDLTTAARRLGLRQVLRVKGCGKLLVRPIIPADEPLMVQFHQALSEETIYNRYFEHITLESRTKHDRLTKICTNDEGSFALVAARSATEKQPAAILAVGRLSGTEEPKKVDFALLVNDKAQGRGIGSALMKQLLALACACGYRRLIGEVLVANHEMLYVCRQFGFSLHHQADDGLIQVELDL